MRTVTLTSGQHGSVLDYVALVDDLTRDPEVGEIRHVVDGRIRLIQRRGAGGKWSMERVDEPIWAASMGRDCTGGRP